MNIPSSHETEELLCGSLFLDHDAASVLFGMLSPGDFYATATRRIFEAASAVFEKNQSIDTTLVCEELKQRGQLEEVGGVLYVSDLVGGVHTTAHAEEHALALIDYAVRRNLLAGLTSTIAATCSPGTTATQAVSLVSNALMAANQRLANIHEAKTDIKSVLKLVWKELESGETKTPYSTGLAGLDNVLGPILPGELIILAARPGVGKSTFGLHLMRRWAQSGVGVGIYSYEMTAENVGRIILSGHSGVCVSKFGGCVEHHTEAMLEAVNEIMNWPIVIDDRPPMLAQLVARIRDAHRRKGLRGALVDYLQLIPVGGRKDNREQEVAAASRTLKRLATELRIPIVVCAQLNRDITNRPKLRNLRESGSIEQDADTVIFLHNPVEPIGPDVNLDIIVAKNRNGETGEISAVFQRGYRRFQEVDKYGRNMPPPPITCASEEPVATKTQKPITSMAVQAADADPDDDGLSAFVAF